MPQVIEQSHFFFAKPLHLPLPVVVPPEDPPVVLQGVQHLVEDPSPLPLLVLPLGQGGGGRGQELEAATGANEDSVVLGGLAILLLAFEKGNTFLILTLFSSFLSLLNLFHL